MSKNFRICKTVLANPFAKQILSLTRGKETLKGEDTINAKIGHKEQLGTVQSIFGDC